MSYSQIKIIHWLRNDAGYHVKKMKLKSAKNVVCQEYYSSTNYFMWIPIFIIKKIASGRRSAEE